jgi:hypothetical protein
MLEIIDYLLNLIDDLMYVLIGKDIGLNGTTFIIDNIVFKLDPNIDNLESLVREGIMTHKDFEILLQKGEFIAKDIQDVFEYRKNHFMSRRETIKRLMIVLKKYDLSFNYIKHIIVELKPHIDNY